MAKSPKVSFAQCTKALAQCAPHPATGVQNGLKLMLGPNLGKADQHVTNTAYADIKAICVMCLSHLAPTCKRNTPLQSDNRKLKYLFDSLLPDLIQCPSPNGLRGVTQFQVSKGNLDQLPTLELFEAHAHVSSSLSSYISTFATSCLQIYVPWAIGKAIP